MTAMNRAMVVAGIITVFQAVGQIVFASLALLQYFCVIDFLRQFPILIFIKILYFHNPSTCAARINIGEAIDGMPNPAFVLLSREPFTATRTFYINSVSLAAGVLWLITCFGIMRGGAENKQSKPIRWPWLMLTVAICGLDLVATVTYINDTFHTKTLSELVDFAGGITSGTGNVEVDTSLTAWVMVIVYSRFAVLFLLNMTLIVTVVIHVSAKRIVENTGVQVEAVRTVTTDASTSADVLDSESEPSEVQPPTPKIPRPGLSQSFRAMKARLFHRNRSPDRARVVAQLESGPNSLNASPERSPPVQHVDIDKKRGVNFPENLLSLPQRLENMIAEQQRRLDKAVVDTSGRHSPPRVSQSLPHIASTSQDTRGRRGTAAELQGQLPWAYIPASAHRMRDQLPPDEDLPPVPLPDYTAIPSFRKASVHRAASSLSSLTQKRDEKSQLPRPPLTQSDVLY
ncbi:uncharacterized protein LOC126380037 isoform X2 [Pectinophora gossypiella]|uniref:uncharacterized protein LOC126380037 isoform X2 n=1 Tax=Pectinophora gossypiella TaxID=13191 RepID=UPI00214E6C84|nr:uncharacterized protein LOC126380037 isoform X2 [Pectinophora gossypiella]